MDEMKVYWSRESGKIVRTEPQGFEEFFRMKNGILQHFAGSVVDCNNEFRVVSVAFIEIERPDKEHQAHG